MFKSFLRTRPAVSIFHFPASTQSTRALELLRSSLTSPYPPSNPKAGPLDFDLEVVESAPTPDQVKTILAYLPSRPSIATAFISAHPASAGSDVSSATLTELAQSNPGALKWPVVVDWMGGRACVGDVDGVREILDAIRKDQSYEASTGGTRLVVNEKIYLQNELEQPAVSITLDVLRKGDLHSALNSVHLSKPHAPVTGIPNIAHSNKLTPPFKAFTPQYHNTPRPSLLPSRSCLKPPSKTPPPNSKRPSTLIKLSRWTTGRRTHEHPSPARRVTFIFSDGHREVAGSGTRSLGASFGLVLGGLGRRVTTALGLKSRSSWTKSHGARVGRHGKESGTRPKLRYHQWSVDEDEDDVFPMQRKRSLRQYRSSVGSQSFRDLGSITSGY